MTHDKVYVIIISMTHAASSASPEGYEKPAPPVVYQITEVQENFGDCGTTPGEVVLHPNPEFPYVRNPDPEHRYQPAVGQYYFKHPVSDTRKAGVAVAERIKAGIPPLTNEQLAAKLGVDPQQAFDARMRVARMQVAELALHLRLSTKQSAASRVVVDYPIDWTRPKITQADDLLGSYHRTGGY